MAHLTTLTFEEHMESRSTVFDDCKKVIVGKDFAVFKFDCKFDAEKALKFANSCNNLYKYTFDFNDADQIVCFNV